MSNQGNGEVDPDREHLEDIDDDCGCAEVWEHMSEHREQANAAADDD